MVTKLSCMTVLYRASWGHLPSLPQWSKSKLSVDGALQNIPALHFEHGSKLKFSSIDIITTFKNSNVETIREEEQVVTRDKIGFSPLLISNKIPSSAEGWILLVDPSRRNSLPLIISLHKTWKPVLFQQNKSSLIILQALALSLRKYFVNR